MEPKEIKDAQKLSCPHRSDSSDQVFCVGKDCAHWTVLEIAYPGQLAVKKEKVGMCMDRASLLKPPVVMQQGGMSSGPTNLGRN